MKHNKALRKPIKGIRLSVLNTVMIVLSCILYVGLIIITGSISERNRQLVRYADEYIACEKAAVTAHDASDFLTEQARLYAESGNAENARLYFEEANVTRSRETALEQILTYNHDSIALDDFRAALQYSDDLMQTEIYAMKLTAVGSGGDLSALPEEIQRMPLDAADAALSPDEMLVKARHLLFNDDYQDAKAAIFSNLNRFSGSILDNIEQRQEESTASLRSVLRHQHIFIAVLLLLTVLTFASVNLLAIKPLNTHIKHIKQNRTLDVIGGYELKYLAQTYNDVYRLNAEHESYLIQKAEHDPLTGALNRTAFEKLRTELSGSPLSLALIFLDIDYFKQVNDRYGHAAGDRVLQSVASLLRDSTRTTDTVVRFGGDEFAVLMTDIPRENLYVIRRKLERINRFLKNPTDDQLPPASVSAGVAFSESGFTEDLFIKADQALYRAKNSGRGSYCFDSDCDIPETVKDEV